MPKRQIIHAPGAAEHVNPTPQAVRMGSMMFTSLITGRDPVTREYPKDIDAQVRLAFSGLRAIMEGAGGSLDNVAHLAIYLATRKDRPHLNPVWEEIGRAHV